MRDPKSPVSKVADFLPEWDKKRPQTVEEQIAMVRELNKAMGGTEVKR